MGNNDHAMRFMVSGRVQGVFFRASTAREATRLGLRGHALNLPDGRVEVLAIGPAPALEQLHHWLQQGPPAARVDGVQALEEAAEALAAIREFRTG